MCDAVSSSSEGADLRLGVASWELMGGCFSVDSREPTELLLLFLLLRRLPLRLWLEEGDCEGVLKLSLDELIPSSIPSEAALIPPLGLRLPFCLSLARDDLLACCQGEACILLPSSEEASIAAADSSLARNCVSVL